MSRKKRKLLTKKQSERIHFKRRLYQRFGIILSRNEYREIKKIIQNKKINGIRENNRKTKYHIKYKDCEFDVIYDKIRKELITVLPPKEELNDN